LANLTGNSLTIHDSRCNTDVKVTFDPSVIVRKSVVGQASDLQETDTITVTGTRQADGSIKANSITIVPAGSAGFGGFGGGAANGGRSGSGLAAAPNRGDDRERDENDQHQHQQSEEERQAAGGGEEAHQATEQARVAARCRRLSGPGSRPGAVQDPTALIGKRARRVRGTRQRCLTSAARDAGSRLAGAARPAGPVGSRTRATRIVRRAEHSVGC